MGFQGFQRGAPPKKTVRVYINKDIEFNVDIYDGKDNCGWLLEEVKNRYLQEMERVKDEIA